MKISLLSASFSLFLVASAHAQNEETILGVRMGSQFALPACPVVMNAVTYTPPTIDCYDAVMGDIGKDNPGALHSKRVFLVNEPRYLIGNIDVELVDNIIVGLDLTTRGIDAQDIAYSALVARFGQPSEHHINNLQNGYGAKYASLNGSWDTHYYHVTLSGMIGDPQHGEIRILVKQVYNAMRAQAPEDRPM